MFGLTPVQHIDSRFQACNRTNRPHRSKVRVGPMDNDVERTPPAESSSSTYHGFIIERQAKQVYNLRSEVFIDAQDERCVVA